MSIEDLAVIVAHGFEGMRDEFSSDLHGEFKGVKENIKVLKDGQEQIKLKLDNVAYRFELVELQRRVDLLEKKVGVKR